MNAGDSGPTSAFIVSMTCDSSGNQRITATLSITLTRLEEKMDKRPFKSNSCSRYYSCELTGLTLFGSGEFPRARREQFNSSACPRRIGLFVDTPWPILFQIEVQKLSNLAC